MLRITMSSPQTGVVTAPPPSRIAIIGGGFTGATIARHLAERGFDSIEEITVFEPRGRLGAGLAYDTQDPSLRLNVAAHRMRAVPGDPGAFVRWLESSRALAVDTEAITDGGIYARRRDFAAFMQDQIKPFVDSGQVRHVRERVSALHRLQGEWQIEGTSGTRVRADIVVLATGYPPPSVPAQLSSAVIRSPKLVTHVYGGSLRAACGPEDEILIVGAGLTALDVIASLRAHGHRGRITLLSRTGLLPRCQAAGDFSPHGEFDLDTVATARDLLRTVRSTLRDVTEDGLPWQSVFDALRHQGQRIWTQLPSPERRRLLRHLRRWYEVHRYRMPPQLGAILEKETESGQVGQMAGRLGRVQERDDRLDVQVTGSRGEPRQLTVDRIVLATGPDMAHVLDHQPLLQAMHRQGLLTEDPLGLGIACDTDSRALARGGNPTATLFVAGPLARGTFGELTGVPEIVAQATTVVDSILRMQSRDRRTILIQEQLPPG
ncbi:FAD-dependent oxidoreductase [Pseudomonas sp. R2.Fl]|nr:FAD-dependent oxidoreductase [Pseudomonas sp. R2.Fl]